MLAAFTFVGQLKFGPGQFSNLECIPATYPDWCVTMSQRGPVPTFWMVDCHSHTPGPRLTSPSARWESPLMCEQFWLPAWACQIQMPHRSEGAFYSLFNSNFKNPPVLFFSTRRFLRHQALVADCLWMWCWLKSQHCSGFLVFSFLWILGVQTAR